MFQIKMINTENFIIDIGKRWIVITALVGELFSYKRYTYSGSNLTHIKFTSLSTKWCNF